MDEEAILGGLRSGEDDVPNPGDGRRNPVASSAPGGDGPDLSSVCAQDNPNDRRHPDASFTCVTCRRKFCSLCQGDDGDCWNCTLLKCWACRRNAQEISMYTCTDCEKIICNEHTFLGHDCLCLDKDLRVLRLR